MKVTKYIKLVLVALTAIMFTACDENSIKQSNENSIAYNKKTAITKIMEYAENGKVAPTVQDYKDLNIVGMTEEKLAELNEVVENSSKEEVDTTEEVQVLAKEIGISNNRKSNADKNVTTTSTSTSPTCGSTCPTSTCGSSCGTSTCGSTCPTSTCGSSCGTSTCGSTCPTSTCGSSCGSTCGC